MGRKPYVVISGVPGSGKTTLGRQLAVALGLRFLDKDDFLEALFEARGIGDAEWRRKLSRESDEMFQAEAMASDGAVLVAHWWVPGMPADSGTPTQWLAAFADRLVNVYCMCAPQIAAARFVARRRHPGHLDGSVSPEAIVGRIRENAALGTLQIGRRVDVDTSREWRLDAVVQEVLAATG